MLHLDLQVANRGYEWLCSGQVVWLCTVLSTYGSAPREPGSLMIAKANGELCGSLSGGCVEEHFTERLTLGHFTQRAQLEKYGAGGHDIDVELPCGGTLVVLVEKLVPDQRNLDLLLNMRTALTGGASILRSVNLNDQSCRFQNHDGPAARVDISGDRVDMFVGASLKIVVAGLSPVAQFCAQYALTLGMEVVICDPREEAWQGVEVPGAECRRELPARYILKGGCHSQTSVVALTHDSRLDDLTMMEAVLTPAFYIGAMGSSRTSAKRYDRLRRIANLSDEQIGRINAPIGLNLGSKSPAQIAIAIMVDILRVSNKINKKDL